MAAKFYWIKERHNPQLGVYYVAYGQISIAEANKRHEEGLGYGNNVMLPFATKAEYEAKISALKAAGKRVQ